jgi:hypothetical protein
LKKLQKFSKNPAKNVQAKTTEKLTMAIYDYLGKQVYQIQLNQPQGQQSIIWNAEGYADGIYYYRLQVRGQLAIGKLVKVN